MHSHIVDLNEEREIKALINKLGQLISADSEVNNRTFDYLNEELAAVDTDKTRTVSIRFPLELLKWIDSYSRLEAVKNETRITRNSIIVNFLETMKAVIEYREKTEWGHSHQDEIAEVVNSIQSGHVVDKGAVEDKDHNR